MELSLLKQREAIWHEQSAIWEIIAGELVVQSANPIAGDREALVERAREGAADALVRLREGDKDGAGHALIGSALALGLAARLDAPETPIESFGAELAASSSWDSAEPDEEALAQLTLNLAAGGPATAEEVAPTMWELAVLAGSYAAGLSPYISRRRQRRDVVEDVA